MLQCSQRQLPPTLSPTTYHPLPSPRARHYKAPQDMGLVPPVSLPRAWQNQGPQDLGLVRAWQHKGPRVASLLLRTPHHAGPPDDGNDHLSHIRPMVNGAAPAAVHCTECGSNHHTAALHAGFPTGHHISSLHSGHLTWAAEVRHHV